ncbi:bifunctional nuclease family protein [Luteococcus sp. Sow4_B9]|uniref:bifunctional nuclease family protein n=1 Tax=Luteococcus sp. Sow4_B9 TaxID=3438792 RepID=UPI003F957D70
MRELDVLGVRVDQPSNAPILLLQESGGVRVLPIWIGAGEAAMIANAMEGLQPPRPLTHDLFVEVLSRLGHEDVQARITEMRDGVFLAELEVDGHVVSARPSDVVALAVRSRLVITAPESLLEEVGVVLDEPGQDEVERFRQFLDAVNPDDFEAS